MHRNNDIGKDNGDRRRKRRKRSRSRKRGKLLWEARKASIMPTIPNQ